MEKCHELRKPGILSAVIFADVDTMESSIVSLSGDRTIQFDARARSHFREHFRFEKAGQQSRFLASELSNPIAYQFPPVFRLDCGSAQQLYRGTPVPPVDIQASLRVGTVLNV